MAERMAWLTIGEHRHPATERYGGRELPVHFVVTRHGSKEAAESYAETFGSREHGVEVRVVGLHVDASLEIRPSTNEGRSYYVRAASGRAPVFRPRRRGATANPKRGNKIYVLKCPKCGKVQEAREKDYGKPPFTYDCGECDFTIGKKAHIIDVRG